MTDAGCCKRAYATFNLLNPEPYRRGWCRLEILERAPTLSTGDPRRIYLWDLTGAHQGQTLNTKPSTRQARVAVALGCRLEIRGGDQEETSVALAWSPSLPSKPATCN